jgi:hypothetical protein
MKSETPKLPGMPGPTKEIIAAHERLDSAVAELHRTLTAIIESLPPKGKPQIKMHFEVLGDSLDITVRPKAKKA